MLNIFLRYRTETRRQLAELSGEPVDTSDPFASLLVLDTTEEKKSRKRRTHDPNAPKRPLTPYFLYLQYARTVIASDLGPVAPKGAVQAEGLRRWNSMPPLEKNASVFVVMIPQVCMHACMYATLTATGLERRLPVQPPAVQRPRACF
jgi:hypothetical protein